MLDNTHLLKRPAAPGTPRPWLLVLMHGIGSNERDLFGLAGQVPDRFCVLSLRAPYPPVNVNLRSINTVT